MLTHRYIGHLQELEHIRQDKDMPPEVLEKVGELQLVLTEQLLEIMQGRQNETKEVVE